MKVYITRYVAALAIGILIPAALISVSSCTTTNAGRVTLACATLANTLNVLNAAKEQGKLSVDTIDAVRGVLPVSDAVCGAENPPENGAEIVNIVNQQLTTLLSEIK